MTNRTGLEQLHADLTALGWDGQADWGMWCIGIGNAEYLIAFDKHDQLFMSCEWMEELRAIEFRPEIRKALDVLRAWLDANEPLP